MQLDRQSFINEYPEVEESLDFEQDQKARTFLAHVYPMDIPVQEGSWSFAVGSDEERDYALAFSGDPQSNDTTIHLAPFQFYTVGAYELDEEFYHPDNIEEMEEEEDTGVVEERPSSVLALYQWAWSEKDENIYPVSITTLEGFSWLEMGTEMDTEHVKWKAEEWDEIFFSEDDAIENYSLL